MFAHLFSHLFFRQAIQLLEKIVNFYLQIPSFISGMNSNFMSATNKFSLAVEVPAAIHPFVFNCLNFFLSLWRILIDRCTFCNLHLTFPRSDFISALFHVFPANSKRFKLSALLFTTTIPIKTTTNVKNNKLSNNRNLRAYPAFSPPLPPGTLPAKLHVLCSASTPSALYTVIATYPYMAEKKRRRQCPERKEKGPRNGKKNKGREQMKAKWSQIKLNDRCLTFW